MEKEQKFTNMEIFFLLVAIACAILGIGYKNLILGGVAVLTGFFALASLIKRKKKSKIEELIMSRTFTIGDLHGRVEALKEVLQKSNFDYEHDTLIVLGDIVDGL